MPAVQEKKGYKGAASKASTTSSSSVAHRILVGRILLSTPIFLWDAAFVYMRPRSLKGGDLRWIWKPYDRLEEVDYLYGRRAYDLTDGFFGAMVVTNLLELFLQLLYVYYRTIPKNKTRLANFFLFAGSCMAVDKLLVIVAQEHFCGYCSIQHNTFQDLLEVYLIPNSLFIFFPVVMMIVSGRDLISS